MNIKKTSRGFTLVELVVVIGIVSLISTVTLANFPNFRDRIALNKESGKVAAALRNAQSFSLGVRQFASFPGPQGACDEVFQSNFPSYGVSFTAGDSAYYLFGDVNCNVGRDEGAEEVESFILEGGVRIQEICVDIDDETPTCGVPWTDVVYARPFPQVKISSEAGSHASVQLNLQSRDGATGRHVIIRNTGQVSVEN
ncbi:hypothetical protein A3J56_00400 [Candidatus Giovannonibacteria bacterium RIFCSPHIGHO2_02_FULL_46_20]|uniref:Type II secretion system protein GspH n=1 Tax=Candidatus Giovannonibacteria bacterium RIFCSPHIGHO2_02_FULL_46_20 TaxID=1798338 RepID=A0A1F5WFN4_9BACT|nr:MAG: hypothetical protein A3J56_00400 [Candidatus Giovannonibacteria bacterium RIFCSPHIGHO2_02_FULL_46_20]